MSTATLDSRVHDFFARFSAASDALDATTLGDCFAEQFLLADAGGARPVPRAAFLAALPRRYEFFAERGIGRAQLVRLDTSTLDAHYVLVHTDWDAPRTDGGSPVRLSSSFLLHDDGANLHIVLYLNHVGPQA